MTLPARYKEIAERCEAARVRHGYAEIDQRIKSMEDIPTLLADIANLMPLVEELATAPCWKGLTPRGRSVCGACGDPCLSCQARAVLQEIRGDE